MVSMSIRGAPYLNWPLTSGVLHLFQKKKRRKIDCSMIGEPTNFMHLTHIGSGEMAEGLPPSGSVQEQMRSKGPSTNGRSSLL
ncbi:unnamed protein product [Oncorhynchus mykiss]|uniref:CRIB domain-containing protein n=1 Tax=Oncorhynchus mykiss TaxID=8022 RepID=A0A060XMV0_ONCMY|nr:unnamed protein product [Oncorhynchus mykiss]